jgi:hypothetical protein
MKNITLFIIAWIIFASTAITQNQTFSFIPGDQITEQIGLDEFKHFRIEIEHPQVDEASFGWKLIENTFLNKWYYSSCDNYGCYSGIPDSSMFGPLPDSVNGFIRITLNANSMAGTGIVKLYIYDVKYPDDGQFVAFEITASEVTAIDDPAQTQFSVYPNPVGDFITVISPSDNTTTFSLIDLSGKTVFKSAVSAESSNTFDVSQLPRGLYFAAFGDLKYRKSFKIIKQ